MSDSRSRRMAAVSEINVTPFVDVLLVLLIIFMVVVPVAPRGLEAALPPKASRSGGGSGREVPLVITIERAGLALNRQPVPTLEALAGRLTDAFAVRTDRTVFVRANADVPYGRVVAVMDLVKGAGAQRIGMVKER